MDTAALSATRCPCVTACKDGVRPERESYCYSSPWMMSLNAQTGHKACWYAAGVKTLSGQYSLEVASELEVPEALDWNGVGLGTWAGRSAWSHQRVGAG